LPSKCIMRTLSLGAGPRAKVVRGQLRTPCERRIHRALMSISCPHRETPRADPHLSNAAPLPSATTGQTVCLPNALIAELFQVTVPTVNEHLTNVYDESELDPGATIETPNSSTEAHARSPASSIITASMLSSRATASGRLGDAFRQCDRSVRVAVKGSRSTRAIKQAARSATNTSRNYSLASHSKETLS